MSIGKLYRSQPQLVKHARPYETVKSRQGRDPIGDVGGAQDGESMQEARRDGEGGGGNRGYARG